MKKIIVCILVVFLFSCKKNADTSANITPKTISAKWKVNNSATYISIEFNESGNYIIYKKNVEANAVVNGSSKTIHATNTTSVIYGTYIIINQTTINLSNYGTISINNFNNSNFDFTLTLTTNVVVTISTIRIADLINTSTNTDLLCRSWKINAIYLNGKLEDNSYISSTHIVFSKAGTYFGYTSNSNTGLAQWRWKNVAETFLYYSRDSIPNWNTANYVEIIELTNYSLKIKEISKSNNDVILVYLTPVIISTNNISNNNVIINTIKNKNKNNNSNMNFLGIINNANNTQLDLNKNATLKE